jgi:threonine/homoserine/homoserine lactone efflux protein
MHFEGQDNVIALISLAGAAYLLHLGISSLRTDHIDLAVSNGEKNSFKKGIVANLLSPHPYLFWITIGGSLFFRALDVDILAVVLFLASFYFMLVGAKITIALFVGKFRAFLKNNYYLYTIRFLGVVYLVFALLFIEQGLSLLGFGVAAA